MYREYMKHLCIDYGTKRVGLATSDIEGRMAFPLRIIPNTKHLVADIVQICKEEHVEKIVMGESRDLNNQMNPIMSEIRPFADGLAKETGLHVVYMNEVLSSREAARMRGEEKGNDASAAAIVLQSYLDSRLPPASAEEGVGD